MVTDCPSQVATRSTLFLFFFHAEDGIRDHCVTGVQTCALPIFLRAEHLDRLEGRLEAIARELEALRPPRSEERRVGKECRSRGSQYDRQKLNGSKGTD